MSSTKGEKSSRELQLQHPRSAAALQRNLPTTHQCDTYLAKERDVLLGLSKVLDEAAGPIYYGDVERRGDQVVFSANEKKANENLCQLMII